MSQYRHIAALGSSFAAGPGIEPMVDADALRSSNNYAHLLAAKLNAQLTDLTVSGATTATILDVPQLTMTGVEFPPQIQGLPATADLVTITAGGNDLQFAGSMLFEAWSRTDASSPLVAMMAPEFPHGIPLPTEESITAMAEGLIRVVTGVHLRAANARVVLVDYLTVLSNSSVQGHDWPCTPEQTAKFRQIQDAIARGYELAAERSDADLLRASELSQDHGLGSAEPWVFGFQPSVEKTVSSFHPNQKGMAAVADALAQLLGE